jgi:hypothetical protein
MAVIVRALEVEGVEVAKLAEKHFQSYQRVGKLNARLIRKAAMNRLAFACE